MNLLNNLNKIVYLLLFTTLTLSAQDSLYLIETLQGKNIDEPIYNIFPVGDINGDGYSDFITVIPKARYCNIYLGGDDFDLEPDIVIKSPTEGYSFNFYFTSGVGDVNNDGYDDFIIPGEYRSDRREFLFLGGETIDTIPTYKLKKDILGSSVSHGDVNGDGYSDFILGSPDRWEGGKAYLFLGGKPLRLSPSFYFVGEGYFNETFGACVDISGDINGDNYDDIIITEPRAYIYPDTILSKIFIYYGKSHVVNIPDTVLNVIENRTMICVNDMNKDGYDDFYLISDSKLYFGSNIFPNDNYLIFSSGKEMDYLGSAGSAGDINKDGYGDLILGAGNHRNSNNIMVGGAYIFLGGAIPDTIPDFALEGETKWSYFGQKVGNLGDLNGDGYNEVYVLAPNYPDYEHPLGKVYIYSMKKFIVGVAKNERTLPKQFRLYQNYPNPFNPNTKIKYSVSSITHFSILSQEGKVRSDRGVYVTLKVYDILGREVATLVNEKQQPGSYEVTFNASQLNSGVYFYTLRAGEDFLRTRKMVLLK